MKQKNNLKVCWTTRREIAFEHDAMWPQYTDVDALLIKYFSHIRTIYKVDRLGLSEFYVAPVIVNKKDLVVYDIFLYKIKSSLKIAGPFLPVEAWMSYFRHGHKILIT